MELEYEREAERVCGAYRTLLRRIIAAILRPVGTEEDAEDCVQEVLWEYMKHADKLNPDRGSEKTYLCVLARSRAQTMRKRLLAKSAVALEDELMLSGSDEMGAAELRDALRAVLKGLGAQERRLFTLRFVYRFPTAETAKELGVSQSVVTTRTSRLREKLKGLLREQGIELNGKE